jgi:methylenetetrahydrofolate dehydrogenase (NADP+)/methenyltetrahydrofolate cyclohydrolase
MTARIIDGKAMARDIRNGLKGRVAALLARGITPRLEVVLVGDNPGSLIYVDNKQRAAADTGIACTIHRFDKNTSQTDVARAIDALNNPLVHGILLQLPLPPHLDATALLNRIAPERDVDGLNLLNVGRRTVGLPSLLPCTPMGCMRLIESALPDMAGKHAVVIGRSDLVGKPMAQLLLRADCTVTQAHAATRNLPDLCRSADILVAAAGHANLVKDTWVKPGAVIIDVGINRVDGKIVGDVDFDMVSRVAGAITPVPGGVGPMTIASLLDNIVTVAEKN